MKNFSELSSEDKERVMAVGLRWYNLHKEHVDSLCKEEKELYPPSGSDCFHPELWKSGHWNWAKLTSAFQREEYLKNFKT